MYGSAVTGVEISSVCVTFPFTAFIRYLYFPPAAGRPLSYTVEARNSGTGGGVDGASWLEMPTVPSTSTSEFSQAEKIKLCDIPP
jgi:hypothetical protein